MRKELPEFSLFYIDTLPDQKGHDTARSLSKFAPDSIGWFILASILIHIAIMTGLAQQTWMTPSSSSDARDAIRAQLIEVPLSVPITERVNTTHVTHVEEKKQARVEPELPQIVEELEPANLAITPSLTATIEAAPAMPKVAISDINFRNQTPIVLQDSFQGNALLSSTSLLPQATREYLQTQHISHFVELGSNASKQYATDLISPELLKGPEPLAKEALAIKTVMQSKIDIDCASTLNQALVIVSAFTVGALLCEDKGDVNYFIEQRLAEKRPAQTITGSAQLKALAASTPTSPAHKPAS
jgi:hypothetical protein